MSTAVAESKECFSLRVHGSALEAATICNELYGVLLYHTLWLEQKGPPNM